MHLPRVIAHRGASAAAPENTAVAMKLAAEQGATWVEFDVAMCKDEACVVIHDATLERTTEGTGPVAQSDAQTLQALEAGGWFDPKFWGEPIPFVRALLPEIKSLGLCANVELKPAAGQGPRLAEVFHTLFQEGGDTWPQILVSSFDRDCMDRFADLAPEVPLGLLLEDLTPVADFPKWQFETIHLPADKVTQAEDLAPYLALGKPILCYTVNDRERADALWAWGVHSVFSDVLDPLM